MTVLASSDTALAVFSFVVLALGFLALPVIWFAFFHGKGDEHQGDRDS